MFSLVLESECHLRYVRLVCFKIYDCFQLIHLRPCRKKSRSCLSGYSSGSSSTLSVVNQIIHELLHRSLSFFSYARCLPASLSVCLSVCQLMMNEKKNWERSSR